MGIMVQFPSPALWHQVLNGPPVSREQGTRNPIGGFNDMVHAQLAKQAAIASLQPPPPRPLALQRPPQKDAREKEPYPRGQQPQRGQFHPDLSSDLEEDNAAEPQPLIRAVWA